MQPVSRAGKCSNEKYVIISTFCDVVKLMSRVKSGFIFPFRLLTCTANSWNSTTDFKNSLTIVNIKWEDYEKNSSTLGDRWVYLFIEYCLFFSHSWLVFFLRLASRGRRRPWRWRSYLVGLWSRSDVSRHQTLSKCLGTICVFAWSLVKCAPRVSGK